MTGKGESELRAATRRAGPLLLRREKHVTKISLRPANASIASIHTVCAHNQRRLKKAEAQEAVANRHFARQALLQLRRNVIAARTGNGLEAQRVVPQHNALLLCRAPGMQPTRGHHFQQERALRHARVERRPAAPAMHRVARDGEAGLAAALPSALPLSATAFGRVAMLIRAIVDGEEGQTRR